MNRFVVTNTKLCIGCQTCAIACATAHSSTHEVGGVVADIKDFYPRLKMVKEGDMTGVVMCRQCNDAPCASVCPTGAIAQGKDSITIDQSKCIGCKTCAIACPYGAMEIVVRDVPRVMNGEQIGWVQVSEAHKCDLCETRKNGPACIEVCPTKALYMIEPSDLKKMRQERQMKTLSAQL